MNKSISAPYRSYLIHIIAWSMFIAYEIWVIWALSGTLSSFWNYSLHYAIVIAWFYLTAEFMLPWSFRGRLSWLWKLPVSAAFLFGVFILANYILDYVLVSLKLVAITKHLPLDKAYAGKSLFRVVYILGIALAYFYIRNYVREKSVSSEAEKKNLQMIIDAERTRRALSKAHNDFLKAQINPHFLFNTLDFVYHNVSQQLPDAAEAIMTLSDMMRYAIDAGSQEDSVLLGEEMEQIDNLVNLYQLRRKQELNVLLNFEEGTSQIKFVPLVLITLAENMFKHGDILDNLIGLQMHVRLSDDALIIETLNAVPDLPAKNSTKAGLRNITERLNYAYGGQVHQYFSNENGLFRVKITVPLTVL